MYLALIFAIISPFIWGFMNVLDKYILSHKIKNPISFAIVAGIVNLIFGIIIAIFLNWSGVKAIDLLFPAVAGILWGLQFYFYYDAMKKTDASYLVGFVFLYPVVVSFLSFIFLKEVLPGWCYLGLIFTIIGVMLLNLRANKIKLISNIFIILALILLAAGYEFFIKVATNNIYFMNGLSITMIFLGLTILPAFFHKKTRAGFSYELTNIKWAFLNEFFGLIAVFTVYFAMNGLSATVVSSISATQPLSVLIFERIFHNKFGKITKDINLLPKLGSIILIVLGVILLSVFGT